MRADSKKCGMIHLGGTDGADVLDVTATAILNVGMECGRLLAEIASGCRVARDASGSLDAPRRRVAGFALSGKERVLLREKTRLEGFSPTRERCRS